MKSMSEVFLDALYRLSDREPFSWETIERLSLHDARLHRAVMFVEQGALTKEQALAGLVVELAREGHVLKDRELARLKYSTFAESGIG
jgi:hypothetical protein